MITEVALAACVATAYVYLYDKEKAKFRGKLVKASERSDMTITVPKGKEKKIEKPIIIELKKREYGWFVKLLLPVGITMAHALKSKLQIESATNSNVEMWHEGQMLSIKFYSHFIPEHIVYYDAVLPNEPLAALIGFGKRGKEILDFRKMVNPNVLIGGMAGMGKSNIVNVILTQLIIKGNVHLFLIDPKRVEFNIYQGIECVKEIAKTTIDAKATARQMVRILEEREELFDWLGYNNIHVYNDHHTEKLPYNILVIDEFGDFSGNEYKSFWDDIGTIARKGRALGCYLMLSTQRPSNDVLNQQVKANLGTQISFKTMNGYNSEIILGQGNKDAVHLPMRSGRAYMNDGTGIWEMQVPFLSRDQHAAILQKVRKNEKHLETL